MPGIDIHEFSLETMRRIAREIRRVEAMFVNLARQIREIRYDDPKVPRNYLLEITETVSARSGDTPGQGVGKVLRIHRGDITEYKPDTIKNFKRVLFNNGTDTFAVGTEVLAIEDAFSKLWVIAAVTGSPGGITNCLEPCLCCAGVGPDTLQVILQGFVGSVGCCSMINGTYFLPKDKTIGGCRWTFCQPDFCQAGGGSGTSGTSGTAASGGSLTLKIQATLGKVEPSERCTCDILTLEVSLVDPLTAETKLAVLFTKPVQYDLDCCLISETFFQPLCYPPGICNDGEEGTVPTAVICAICPPEPCEPCGPQTRKFLQLTPQGITNADCTLCDLSNVMHLLTLDPPSPVENCKWTGESRSVQNCETRWRATVENGGIGKIWTAFFDTWRDGIGPSTVLYKGESLTCDADELELNIDSGVNDCGTSGSSVILSTRDDVCLPLECCDEPDQKELLVTLFSSCLDIDGLSKEMPAVPGIDLHQQWQILEDWFVCSPGAINLRARMDCVDGQYLFRLGIGTGTTSGCSSMEIRLTPFEPVQCNPFLAKFKTTIFNTGTPIDCLCCPGGLPFELEFWVTLNSGSAAALVYRPEGMDARALAEILPGNSGPAMLRVGGEDTGTTITVHYNHFTKGGAARKVNSGDDIWIVYDRSIGKTDSQKWGIRGADSECPP